MSTILIVEDSKVCRDPIVAILERKGYKTVCAANGREALAILQNAPPDLVLLDVAMPVMDGMSLLRVLRNDPRWNSLPVLLLTATSNKDAIKGSEKLGVSGTLYKEQFSLADMVECVKKLVPPSPASTAA